MGLNLTLDQRKELKLEREKLGVVKALKSGIYSPFEIPPSDERVRSYEAAVSELSRNMGDLVNGVYEVYLMGQGDWYATEVGINGVDVSQVSLGDLERTMHTIIDVMEINRQRLFSDPAHYNQRAEIRQRKTETAIKTLLENGGSLEYFDRLTFFDTNF